MIGTLFNKLLGRSPADLPKGFASANEIHDTLARERMRIDRRGGAVCLLTFEIPSARHSRDDVDRITQVMQLRLRNTDFAGLLNRQRIAVVLPDTYRSGAEKLAADIRAACDYTTIELPHSISEYARDDDSNRNGHDEREVANSTNSQRGDISTLKQPAEAVFCSPVPLWKRAMDIAGASFGLLIFSPLLIGAALLVRITSPGPIFFVQKREGRGGRIFPMLKFRTMRIGAEQEQARLRQFSEQDGPAFKMKNDPRLTRIGSLLRRTSIDEMPQLLNVLRGEMSLVGPRPLPQSESVQCTGWQRRRLHVNPGLTCIWQVRARSSVSFVEWVRMDLEYVQNMSLLLDVKLLVQTLPVLLGQQGAH